MILSSLSLSKHHGGLCIRLGLSSSYVMGQVDSGLAPEWFGICCLWFHGVLDWRQFTQSLMEFTNPSLSALLILAVYCDSVGSIMLPRMGNRPLKTLRIHSICNHQLLEAFLFQI